MSKDGRQVDISLTVSPVRDRGGGLWVCQRSPDITDRRKAEDALREADRRKEHFIALLAHELRIRSPSWATA